MTDKVTVVPCDAAWPGSFALLAGNLRTAMGDVAVRIDHIGSTAVPGLSAKPVIDIQVSVRSLEPRDAYQRAIESCGFVPRRHNPDRTKRYFREAPGARQEGAHDTQSSAHLGHGDTGRSMEPGYGLDASAFRCLALHSALLTASTRPPLASPRSSSGE